MVNLFIRKEFFHAVGSSMWAQSGVKAQLTMCYEPLTGKSLDLYTILDSKKQALPKDAPF
jgi:hypothetical protein